MGTVTGRGESTTVVQVMSSDKLWPKPSTAFLNMNVMFMTVIWRPNVFTLQINKAYIWINSYVKIELHWCISYCRLSYVHMAYTHEAWANIQVEQKKKKKKRVYVPKSKSLLHIIHSLCPPVPLSLAEAYTLILYTSFLWCSLKKKNHTVCIEQFLFPRRSWLKWGFQFSDMIHYIFKSICHTDSVSLINTIHTLWSHAITA